MCVRECGDACAHGRERLSLGAEFVRGLVSALEVEAAIGRLAGVDRVVVVGVPSDEWGQEVVAGIVWREGARDRDAVAGELAGALSRVKIPKRIVALDDIPLTSIGKVNRRGSLDLIVRGLEQS